MGIVGLFTLVVVEGYTVGTGQQVLLFWLFAAVELVMVVEEFC